MNGTKTWIIALILIVVGAGLFAVAMAANGWDFTQLSTRPYVTKTHTVTEPFTDLSINASTAKVVLLPSSDGTVRVTCFDDEHVTYEVVVRDGTLEITPMYKKKAWHEHIAITLEQSKITVELPESVYGTLTVRKSTGRVEIPADFAFENIDITTGTGDISVAASVYGSLKLHTSTGDIRVEGGTPTSMDLSVSTGKINVTDVTCSGDLLLKVSTGKSLLTNLTCKNLTTQGNTGDITLKNVIATESISIKRTTGDVRLERCDAAALVIETDTGDVTGSLRTAKIFAPKTDTGKIRVPQSDVGGRCEITTSTGDITLEILE